MERLTNEQKQTLDAWRTAYTARKATAKKTRRVYDYVLVTPSCGHDLTETGVAYLQKAAATMAYTAAKTVYLRSCNPYIRRILDGASLSIYKDNIVDGLSDLALSQDGGRLQASTTHKRRVHGMTVQTLELDLTELGKATLDKEINKVLRETTSLEIEDLQQTALVSLLEMVDTIPNFCDVWQFRRRVYKALRNAIHGEHKANLENERFADVCEWIDDNGIIDIRAGASVDKEIDRLVNTDAVEKAIDYLVNTSRKTDNKARNKRILTMAFIDGKGYQEIADTLNINVTVIKNCIRYTKARANNDPKMWEVIHDILNDK